MSGARLPDGQELTGRYVRLQPLTEADLPEVGLLLADPGIYADGYVMHRRPSSADDSVLLARERFLGGQGRLDGSGGGRMAYAVRLVGGSALGRRGELVGTTSLLEPHVLNESIHVGSTLYGRRWWGSQVNPECKLLLLQHCFEECGYGRVKIQTDALNTRSQSAIARLGAVREGVLRRDMRREDGTFRDTVVFSVLRDEWPTVKARLESRLD
ncbi:GNAT family N-acetyltransferase [Motilibacter deserti]|uniref:GNAT family N-acetyltransferase n=1 Tax=Motilibacter deserti TaxID=2714956 RepID=A0ABX0GXG1_9ACTN|nr:GNAT family protein [Motilibacter deserti]NHC14309.1 GNAT family N-acetyltransferase [Motilibacter deserti]